MEIPLVGTKLYVPRPRRALVPRPRLAERLSYGAAETLTLVSAPAGFGKTTLLAEWAAAVSGDGPSVAWVSLDSRDNQPVTFWTYVVSALQAAVPGVGAGALALLRSSRPSMQAVLATVLNELGEAPHEVGLVLDDYHVIDDLEIHAGMSFLLEHLPGNVHVVIGTRADPPLPLPRLRARGELVEIRAADLRFTVEEAAAYLTGVAGLDLAAADVAVLESRTEGWIAALQLAALSMQGRADRAGFVAGFAGDDRYVVDYLAEEVLARQPDDVREFLLATAVLDRLTGDLCDAVTERADGVRMLESLERANLFVVALDDRREWYRYHHLFADVLRARLPGEHAAPLHLRASGWYERHDLMQDAVDHALAARDVDRAAHLVERALPAVRRARQDAVLLGWLDALPDDAIARSPVLTVCSGWSWLVRGDLDGVEARLDDADRALAGGRHTSPDDEELHALPATIAMYRASLAQARGDVAGTAAHARRALDLAGPAAHAVRGAAAAFLGFAAWSEGQMSAALETFTQAVASLHAAGNVVDELSSTVVLADMWLAAGRPGTARRLYQRALRAAESQGTAVARATAELHVGLAEIDRDLGDLDSARRHLDTAAALGARVSMTESSHRWFVAMARVADAEGDPEAALGLLDEAERLHRPGFFPDVRPIAAMKARIRIVHGRLVDAADWARDRRVSATDEVGYLREFDHLTLVRLLLARYRAHRDTDTIDQAVHLLERLAEAAQTSGRAGSLVEIRMLAALAHHARGERPRAREVLGRALAEVPEPDGYVRLFLDEGVAMTALLADAEPRDVGGDQVRRLLDLGAADRRRPTASATSSTGSSAEALTERELQVLRLLDSELTGPQIARELYVSHNTLRTHTKHIFTKLDVTNRRAAVRRARERGLM
ncbi:MAG: LuxR C-terminal-related transcriptional regulator [Pseudonocardia sp.]